MLAVTVSTGGPEEVDMRVPVILDLPHQASLRESAQWAQSGRPRGIPRSARLPDQVVIDPSFSAVPIGARTAAAGEVVLNPERWTRFAVRGSVEVSTLQDVPLRIGDAHVLADPLVDSYVGCLHDPATGDSNDVAQRLNVEQLHDAGLNGDNVALAIVDTGINLTYLTRKLGWAPRFDLENSWRPPGLSVAPGEHLVAHGTMCAYAALIAAPKATLIDVPILLGTPPGGSGMGRRLSTALEAVARLTAFWAVAFAAGGQNRYKALVVNNSWGMYHPSWDFPPGHPGRYSDNPDHVFNHYISLLSQSNADIVFAAGNCGNGCPDNRCQGVTASTITGANAIKDVLTVAACDVAGEPVGYSSQGPAIAGMAAKKPDVAAYSHFEGSEALGIGKPDVGTSAACPVAAGCIAALRSSNGLSGVSPAELFEILRQTARQSGENAWTGDLGFGVIDPAHAAVVLGLLPSS